MTMMSPTRRRVAMSVACGAHLPCASPPAVAAWHRCPRRGACVAAALPWQALPWSTPRLGRGPRLLAHATTGDEEQPAALKFLKQLQGKLPVIGLVSRLTTPGGGFDSRLSFGEFCRSVGESEARREFNVAVAELARSRKLNSRALMLLCWMISQGGGIVPDDLIKSAALRLGSRNSDMEYEAFRFEETLDAALQRRQRMQDRAPSLVPRSQLAPLTTHCLRAFLRLGPEEVLAGDDEQYVQDIVNGV